MHVNSVEHCITAKTENRHTPHKLEPQNQALKTAEAAERTSDKNQLNERSIKNGTEFLQT